MINSLEPGDPLPDQPQGPLGSSDTMTVRELLHDPGYLGRPFSGCIRGKAYPPQPTPHDPSLGWTQTGEHHFSPFGLDQSGPRHWDRPVG